VGDLKSYPTVQTLEIRIRQMRPEVVLLELASDLDAACALIAAVCSMDPPAVVVGLHRQNDSEAIVRSLRAGAQEFLYAPFEVSIQEAAISRIEKLVLRDEAAQRELGKVLVFSSTKPGSGATTLATQTAFALSRKASNRALLVDLDLMGGAIGFQLDLDFTYTVLDLLQHSDRLDSAVWAKACTASGALDILPAPETPYSHSVEPAKLHDLLQFARYMYDWIILDVPAIFHRLSLLTVSEADRAFLVSTPELASLHLARKAVRLLNQLGFDAGRYQVLINRVDRRNEFNGSDIGKLLDCKIDGSLPNDFFALQRASTGAQPLAGDSELGKAIEGLATKLFGGPREEKKKAGRRGFAAVRPVTSQL
jgi:pilus assembly protein CpaE